MFYHRFLTLTRGSQGPIQYAYIQIYTEGKKLAISYNGVFQQAIFLALGLVHKEVRKHVSFF